jgi:hypothetical protein
MLFCFSGLCIAQSPAIRSKGQALYLPIYSHIWHGDVNSSGRPVKTLVSVLVSIRNTDPVKSIRLVSAQYYDTDGKRIKEYIAAPSVIKPMGTYEIFVPLSDDTGGSGANFVVNWQAESPASPPLVEGVHANIPAGRSIVFVTTARPILPE